MVFTNCSVLRLYLSKNFQQYFTRSYLCAAKTSRDTYLALTFYKCSLIIRITVFLIVLIALQFLLSSNACQSAFILHEINCFCSDGICKSIAEQGSSFKDSRPNNLAVYIITADIRLPDVRSQAQFQGLEMGEVGNFCTLICSSKIINKQLYHFWLNQNILKHTSILIKRKNDY